MTQRDKNMATILSIVVVVGGGLLGGIWFFRTLSATGQEIEDLEVKVKEGADKIKKAREDGPKLQHWRRLSLVGDLHVAARIYREDLTEMLRKHSVQGMDFRDEQARTKSSVTRMGWDSVTNKQVKQPLWTGINYQVTFQTKMANLVAFIKDFQSMPRMHRIKGWTAERADEKKEGELLSVKMNFEAISILDAEQFQQKAGINDVVGLQRVEVADTVAALRNAPGSMALMGWSAGPKGATVRPLNPPLSWARKYGDIQYKNFFLGFVQVSNVLPEMDGPPPSDETINAMRFNRFVALTNEEGKSDAWLWDSSNSLEKKRVGTEPGFNRFTILQSGDLKPIVQGVIVKFEKSDIIYRVDLKASSPTSSKWWRYPKYTHFYSLHQDDFSPLSAAGKVKETDRGNLYLVDQDYWDRLTKAGKEQIDIYPDGKTFRFLREGGQGEIITSDSSVVIVRVNPGNWPPNADVPSVGVSRIYSDDKTIYRIQSNHFAELLADKNLTGSKKLKADEIDRVYVVRTPYWDLLAHQKVLIPDTYQGTFRFYGDRGPALVKGDIISRNDEAVVIRVADKYCQCPGDREQGTKDRWHEGFCVLRIDRYVQDSLMEPLSEARVKEFLKPAVSANASGQ